MEGDSRGKASGIRPGVLSRAQGLGTPKRDSKPEGRNGESPRLGGMCNISNCTQFVTDLRPGRGFHQRTEFVNISLHLLRRGSSDTVICTHHDPCQCGGCKPPIGSFIPRTNEKKKKKMVPNVMDLQTPRGATLSLAQGHRN